MPSFSKTLELVLFPSFCRLCGDLLVLNGERIVCRNCLSGLESWLSPFCLRCGRFVPFLDESNRCVWCEKLLPPFSLHRSCGPYRGGLKDVILLLKFHGCAPLAEDLAAYAWKSVEREDVFWRNVDVVLPVPLHKKKRKRRGYNQSSLVARILSRKMDLPFNDGVLRKIHDGRAQMLLEAEARWKNVENEYVLNKSQFIYGKTVLLVDDVFTTGATVSECSRVLLKGGAKEVRALTLAQAL